MQRLLSGLFILFVVLAGCTPNRGGAPVTIPVDAVEKSKPNILIIVADDLGYSDVGAYGGEIATPNIDGLAREGVRLTHFHSAPSCSPTRAMLLSGTDNHIAGLGAMAEHIPEQYRGRPGFEGVLSNRVATLAERFNLAGYRTLMSGKWHLGMDDGERPAQRGFDSSFALLQGAANHFGKGGFGSGTTGLAGANYVENDQPFQPGSGFYSSDVFASKLIDQIGQGDNEQPFFAYLAFSAPHSPLQAPEEDISRYLDTYKDGWTHLAQTRLEAMRAVGVLPGEVPASTEGFGPIQGSWDGLSPTDKAREVRRMAIYAAMVDRMDRNIGRVLAALRKSGQMDNTIIMFMSDNGPVGEDPRQYAVMPGFTDRFEGADQSLSAMGGADSFVLQNPQWARAIAAPSRLFKAYVTEGGTLVPLIIKAPGLPGGTVNTVFGEMRDIVPTLHAMTGVPLAKSGFGRSVAVVEGTSLYPWLKSATSDRPDTHVAFGFNGQSTVRSGAWKAMRIPKPLGDGEWHLYNVIADPSERDDQKAAEPELFAALMKSWKAYEMRHGLIVESQAETGRAGHSGQSSH